MNALSIEVKKVINIPCKSFESKLLFESRLSPDSVDYAVLGKVLFHHLTFDDRYAIGKLYAVVAGSYPAFLGKTVKTYGNVNVFIIANDRNLVQYLLHSLSCDICTQDKYEDICTQDVYEQHRVNGGIITVTNFGKIQFIVKQHYTCLCDFHLNTLFSKISIIVPDGGCTCSRICFLLDTCISRVDVIELLFAERRRSVLRAVSYTHLTLPTILRV